MSDLHTLLERAADHPADQAVDLALNADLHRGRAALRRRRRVLGGAIAAALLVAGSGTWIGLSRSSERPPAPSHSPTDTVHAGAFDIPPPPDGWYVWSADASYVLIAPDGTPPLDPSGAPGTVVATGKLAISLTSDANGSPEAGPTIDYDGRAFFDNESAGGPAAQVGYEVSPGRWLVLQEAPALHWTAQQMIEYLDGVVVTSAAVPMG